MAKERCHEDEDERHHVWRRMRRPFLHRKGLKCVKCGAKHIYSSKLSK